MVEVGRKEGKAGKKFQIILSYIQTYFFFPYLLLSSSLSFLLLCWPCSTVILLCCLNNKKLICRDKTSVPNSPLLSGNFRNEVLGV